MGSLGWVLAASVKAAVLLGASGLGAVLLRRRAPAARHQVWSLGVAGALLVPVLTGVMPSLSWSMPRWLATPSLDAGGTLLGGGALITGGATATAPPAWPTWLAIAWAVGTLLVALRFVRAHVAARRIACAARPADAETWTTALGEAAAAIGVDGDVALGRSEAIGSPMTVGVVRPRVLLPAAADGWSPERLRAVLLHELAHVRRRDTLIQVGAQLACALYWWNPLAWVAAARLRVEREQACDDLVLGAGVPASAYASDLLDVAQTLAPDGLLAGAVPMADRTRTEVRLRRILDATAPRRPVGVGFRLAARGATLVVAAALACCSAPAAQQLPPAPAEPPTPRGSLSLGALTYRTYDAQVPAILATDGDIDLPGVEAEVKRRVGTLEDCYERRLVAAPTLAGTIEIHWGIGADGKVLHQCLTEDSVDDAELSACVNELVSGATFPRPRSGSPVSVSYPFVFAARR